MKLITLSQAKEHLRVTHDSEDVYIDSLIDAASDVIADYIGGGGDSFLDSSGLPDVLVDTDARTITGYVVPPRVQQACKILIGEWFKNREGEQAGAVDPQFGYGYAMPRPAIALLYSLRVPVVA